MLDGNAEAHAVYAINAFGYITPEIISRMQDNYISTGIYRCSILDIDMKFCENFETSRISADKRFLFMSTASIDSDSRLFIALTRWTMRRIVMAKLR